MRKLLIAVVLSLVAVLAGGACSDDGDGDDTDDATEETTEATNDDGNNGDAEASGTEISIDDFAFSPSTLEVEAGATVTVTNNDSATHTWTSTDGEWDSDDLDNGATFEHTFDEAGTFDYRCNIHTSMTGTITVT